MPLGARRKAIQRDCGRVRGFTLPREMARLGEGLNRFVVPGVGTRGRKKRAPTCSAPMEEYPGKISKKPDTPLL